MTYEEKIGTERFDAMVASFSQIVTLIAACVNGKATIFLIIQPL